MNVLIIGLGSIALKHINALTHLVVNPTIYALRSRQNTAENNNLVRNIYHINEINIDDIDFIIISNPTSSHYESIKTCIAYKKPLLIEKPVFSEVNHSTDCLVDEINKQNLITYIACNLRFLDCIKELQHLLIGQRINEVNAYGGSYLPDWRPEQDFRKVYSARKELGGGVHIDLIHEIDYIYWFFGTPKKTNNLFTNKSSLAISAYDYANYLWEYDEFNVSIILNYYRRIPKRTIEILTEVHTYEIDLLENSIKEDGNIIFKSNQKIIDTYKPQMSHFLDIVKNNQPSLNTIDDAYEILKLCIQE